ncbi:MAG: winged helix DNA-binding protein [Lachnospiraceae bacterium]|nr:winged helix DNA-binding protein [Lachnospiraceae bacterium]
MATKAQIKMVLEEFKKVHPPHPAGILQRIDERQEGVGAVLHLLHESDEMVTAGRISEVLGISTARVAVLLKKMVLKGLIIKEHVQSDARITVVSLTEQGRETIQAIEDEIFYQMGIVIDKVGEERVLEFIAIAKEIQNAVTFNENFRN